MSRPNQLGRLFVPPCRVRVQSTSMQQRLGVLSLALFSSICAGSTALAGPLSLNPQSQPGGRPYAAARAVVAPQAAPERAYAQQPLAEPASPEPRARYAAAQNMGGGF